MAGQVVPTVQELQTRLKALAENPGVALPALVSKTTVEKILEEEKIEPLRELIELYRNAELPDRDKIKLLEGMLPYVYPKLKTQSTQQAVNRSVTIKVVQHIHNAAASVEKVVKERTLDLVEKKRGN